MSSEPREILTGQANELLQRQAQRYERGVRELALMRARHRTRRGEDVHIVEQDVSYALQQISPTVESRLKKALKLAAGSLGGVFAGAGVGILTQGVTDTAAAALMGVLLAGGIALFVAACFMEFHS